MRAPRGRNARSVYWHNKFSSHGDWPFKRDEQGRWVCRKTGKLATVMSLQEFLELKPRPTKTTGECENDVYKF